MSFENRISIVKSDSSNINELIELSKAYYSTGDIIDSSYLNWQYHQNPSGKPYLFISRTEKENKLVGQYLIIPIIYNFFNKPVKGTLSLNTLTHPDFQGKGLFTKMAIKSYEECAKNNILFTTGFPNPLSYPGFVKKLDFTHLGDIPLFIKPLRPINMALSFFKTSKEKHGGNIELSQVEQNGIFKLNFENDSSKINDFWSKIKSQYPISTERDSTFLKWRYCDLPTRKYQLYAFEADNVIKSIIVLKAEKTWGFNVGIIMDFLVLQGEEHIGKQMLQFTKRIFKMSKLDFSACLHSPNFESDFLMKNGFFKVPQRLLPQKVHFIVRKNNEFVKSEEIFNLKNWKLTFGDYDVF